MVVGVTVSVGIINTMALVVFAIALCWRLDQIRRNGWGLQPLAMTVAIAALTLSFVVADDSVTDAMEAAFTGASRVVFYALLAVAVAALVVVFFFPGPEVSRERRAGLEALPLVVALVGLQVTMLVIPVEIRTASISEWTARNWSFALFFLIACGYLSYGFVACVRSVYRFFQAADGYLRTSLGLLVLGLGLLAVGSLAQICFVLVSMGDLARMPWLLTTSRILTVLGVVAFLFGISYPMVHSRIAAAMANRRRRRMDTDLIPLWRLVTEAVPEVVLPNPGILVPTTRLHRRVVETRDALTQISPFLPRLFEYADVDVQARLLKRAVEEYREAAEIKGAVWDVVPDDGAGLEADAEPLRRLSQAVAAEEFGLAQR
ncbi:hypothetical protein QSJ18_01320 [Gordonia sp. ABSL1-1]|uniref:MAB_1171c family putative transporter n=1 Tax=Gordonia sp. ABSL1-1 TaxID=3053923 RepID=UPI0025728E2F|nr:MAB_1171c family putative transporter [Gordonia sp. ABSL1-1]MDL9935376.1 hypothetical protein [Gordonia sp. ABSL1-1]